MKKNTTNQTENSNSKEGQYSIEKSLDDTFEPNYNPSKKESPQNDLTESDVLIKQAMEDTTSK